MMAKTSVTELSVVLFCCFNISLLSTYISDATLNVGETLSHLILIINITHPNLQVKKPSMLRSMHKINIWSEAELRSEPKFT